MRKPKDSFFDHRDIWVVLLDFVSVSHHHDNGAGKSNELNVKHVVNNASLIQTGIGLLFDVIKEIARFRCDSLDELMRLAKLHLLVLLDSSRVQGLVHNLTMRTPSVVVSDERHVEVPADATASQ